MTLTHRKINVTFALAKDQFRNSDANTVTITGLRVSATIVKAGGVDKGSAQIRIFGLSPSIMAQLSTYGLPAGTAVQNSVQLSAGDDTSMAIVASGTITQAWADYSQMPEVVFNVEVVTAQFDAIKAIAPSSYPGTADAADIMASLAKTMGYSFENNGVSVQLSTPYFWGTAWTQASECAIAGNIAWTIENNTLAIWPKNGTRKGDPVMISTQTGMVGYPTFTQGGIVVTALFNPAMKFGSMIQVQSSLAQASGMWAAFGLVYELESETPNGQWFMKIEALKPGFVPQ